NIDTAITISKLCKEFPSLKMIILVGIAGGSKDSKIGDVVVSSEIFGETYYTITNKSDYSKSRQYTRTNETILEIREKDEGGDSELRLIVRHKPITTMNLDSIIKNFNEDKTKNTQRWKKIIKKYLEGGNVQRWKKDEIIKNGPKIIPGRIWSSNHNMRNKVIRDQLASTPNGVNAFDMEGNGLALAAGIFERKFVEIRGISDMSDGKRKQKEDKKNQFIAIATASACLESLLPRILQHINLKEI
ncbi:MAG: hypothetical protein WBF38_06260, partial [Nitrosotalea sp.]